MRWQYSQVEVGRKPCGVARVPPHEWFRHLFDTEEKACGFGGRWKDRIVRVEVRPLAAERVEGEVDFYPHDIYPDK